MKRRIGLLRALSMLLPAGAMGASAALATTPTVISQGVPGAEPQLSVSGRLSEIRSAITALDAGATADSGPLVAKGKMVETWWGNGGWGRWRFGWGNGGWHNGGWGNGGWHNWHNWGNGGWNNGGWHNFWHNW